MTEDEELQHIREEQSLSVATDEDFKILTETQEVFYRYGEGYQIQALIENEEQFIEFMQKVGIMELWDKYVPFFVNNPGDFDKWFEYKDTVRRSEMDTVETFQFGDDDPVIITETLMPTVKKRVLLASWNQYSDKPFRINKQNILMYGPEDIKVKGKVKSKFPCVCVFVSHDTFDRYGSLEGSSLQMIELNKLTNKPLFA